MTAIKPSAPLDASRVWFDRTGTRKAWETIGVGLDNAGAMARKYGARLDWGTPVEAFIMEEWLGGESEWSGESTIRVLACLYDNGRVADIRLNKRSWRARFYPARQPKAASIRNQGI